MMGGTKTGGGVREATAVGRREGGSVVIVEGVEGRGVVGARGSPRLHQSFGCRESRVARSGGT